MNYVFLVVAVLAAPILFQLLLYVWRFLGLPNFKKETYFRDSYNRIKIYRGVNICNYAKTALPDFLPWHTEQDYARLKNWGFNLVRFLVFWEAIEPEKNKYNTEYLNKVKEHISILEKLGIDVIVDLHQDLYSRKFTGNGFPEWALPPEKHPFKPATPWWKNYFTPAVMDCYKYFWKNDELKNKYVELVNFVQYSLKDCKNVIGIDVLNEPFPNFPFIWRFEKKYLNDLYSKMKITSSVKDFSKTLFFESWILTSTGAPTNLDSKLFGTRNVHMPHYYPPFCHNKGNYNWFNRLLAKTAFRSKTVEARKLNSPALIGEIGISTTVKDYMSFVRDMVEAADKHKINWLWYCYDKEVYSGQGLIDNNGNEREYLEELVRIYPQRIAGSNPKWYIKNNTFCFECDYDATVSGTTEIFVPAKYKYEIKTDLKYVIKENIVRFEQTKKMRVEIKFSLKQ